MNVIKVVKYEDKVFSTVVFMCSCGDLFYRVCRRWRFRRRVWLIVIFIIFSWRVVLFSD